MSVKVLANKILAFDQGEKDANGVLKTVRTNIGFCELPNWAAETDYFKLAESDGSITSFTSPGEPETVLKEQEKLAAIRAEIKAAEEKLDLMRAAVTVADVPADAIHVINVTPEVDVPVVTDTVVATPDTETTTTGKNAKTTVK